VPLPRSLTSHEPIGDHDLRLVAGAWPDDLGGELFVTTSEQATAGRHAFFGDGVLLRLSLQPGTFGAAADRWALRGKVLDTPSRRLRERTPEVFQSGAYGTSSPYGPVNAANTAPLPWGDRLFATWDAGRPVEVDPVSLSFLGDLGHTSCWPTFGDLPVLPYVFSSAHPIIDPERDVLWTVAYDPLTQQCTVVRYGGEGGTVDTWPVADASIPQSMHTITQTRDWLVLVDCAFRADPNELFGGERSLTTLEDEPIYLIRKGVFDAVPPGQAVPVTAFRLAPAVNHFYAAYDDADGVRIVFEHTPDTDLAMAVREGDLDALGRPVDPALIGIYAHPAVRGTVSEVVFHPETGAVEHRSRLGDDDQLWAVQLSALDWSREGQERPTVHHQLFNGYRPEVIPQRYLDLYAGRIDVAALPREEVPAVLTTLDRDTLKSTGSVTFSLDDYPTSPCFVPRGPGSDDAAGTSRYAGADPGGHDGYLVLPVQSDAGFRVEVYDAAGVADGPVATLATADGSTLPFLIHSAWMPAAEPADRSIERLRFADELDDARLATLPGDLAAAARAVAADLDDALA
jgi:carotenoid cleavage dioxygenase-like enzyme